MVTLERGWYLNANEVHKSETGGHTVSVHEPSATDNGGMWRHVEARRSRHVEVTSRRGG